MMRETLNACPNRSCWERSRQSRFDKRTKLRRTTPLVIIGKYPVSHKLLYHTAGMRMMPKKKNPNVWLSVDQRGVIVGSVKAVNQDQSNEETGLSPKPAKLGTVCQYESESAARHYDFDDSLAHPDGEVDVVGRDPGWPVEVGDGLERDVGDWVPEEIGDEDGHEEALREDHCISASTQNDELVDQRIE